MPKKKNPNIDTYKVLTGDWYSVIQVENDIFDDGYIEACTRAMEIRVKQLVTNNDLLVNPAMICKHMDKPTSKERYINTYKILLNAGMPHRANLLRSTFMQNVEIDLASEPMSASLKR
ncbi:MAG: hypothetical protein WCL22_04870 [bacterium]